MTEIRNNAPDQDRKELLAGTFTNKGVKIEFKKPCLSGIHVYRKKPDETEWKEIGRNVHFPFYDAEFPRVTEVRYRIKVLADEFKGDYEIAFFPGNT